VKKPATKKPAVKKPAAKKPAVKKPAAAAKAGKQNLTTAAKEATAVAQSGALVNHVIFVVDRSGSMSSIRRKVVSVFNSQLAALKKNAEATGQATFVSFYTFHSVVDAPRFFALPIAKVPKLDAISTTGATALLDATGQALVDHQSLPGGALDNVSFIVLVLTDGYENHSRKYKSKIGAMIKSAREGTNEAVSRAQAKVLSLYPPNQYGRFLTNHDQTRVMRMLKNDEGAMRMAATMLLTGPGVPFIYYGEEIGMTGDKPDEYLRTPMQWSGNAGAGFTAAKPWEPANSGTEKRGYESVNVENQMKETRSLLGLYRRLIRIRGEHAALGSGDMIPVESGSKQVYSFLRHAGSSGGGTSEDVLVVINLGNEAVKEFGLSVSRSPLRGAVAAKELLQGADATVPVCDENGGFGGYRPLETLSARTGYVILLGKP
jgi:hypothetical protein